MLFAEHEELITFKVHCLNLGISVKLRLHGEYLQIADKNNSHIYMACKQDKIMTIIIINIFKKGRLISPKWYIPVNKDN